MSLAAGTSLGGYEIVSLLGEGGMGEVYRARDPRLERDVAIKVLTAAGANDAELLRRLRQEAKTIAALNHPNLLSIFDLGATPEGAPFLVMELLQGETLRARLHQGPLPLRRALAFGRQLADALAAAHEQGIIHRDLKPENIFLLADGRIKILDFGLAKALRSDAAAFDAEAPTVVGSAATMPGMVLGTVGYMAPEQVRGEAATSRSDIFAFGAILYEMLAGRRAFAASSSMEVMSAILRDDPPEVTMAGAALPAGVDRLLRRCLEKEPRLRFQNAADLGYALSSLEEANSSTQTRALPAAKPRTRRRWWELAVAVLAGAALTAFFVLGRGGPDLTRIRYSLFVAGNVASRGAWSPDGTAVAYTAAPTPGDPPQVFVRYLANTAPTQLTHRPDAAQVVGWTADGQQVLYLAGDTALDSVAAVGGAPRQVATLPRALSARTMAVSARAWALFQAGTDGRTAVLISSPPGSPWKPYLPAPFASTVLINEPEMHFSPDGAKLLLFLNAARGREEAWLLPFPANSSRPPRQILTHLPALLYTPQFAWLPDNRRILAVASHTATGDPQLCLIDTASGRLQQLTTMLTPARAPTVSPDGKQALFVRTTGAYDVVSARLSDGVVEPMLDDAASNNQPDWSLRAPVMVYLTARDGKPQVWLHSVDPTGEAQDRPLADASTLRAGEMLGPTLSPHAHRLLYAAFGANGNGSVHLFIASTAGGKPIRLTDTSATSSLLEVGATWSPNGDQAVYVGLRGQNADLMLAPTTGQATPHVLRANVDSLLPVWSPDGAWIAYQSGSDDTVHLISPDGRRDRNLGKLDTAAVAFSSDGKLLYGIQSLPHHNYLFAVDLASGTEHRIADLGEDFTPQTGSQPTLRFTLTPDGKSLTYNTARQVRSLVRMQDFAPAPTGIARLRALLHVP